MKKYFVSYADRLNYVSLILLNEIINFQHYFPVTLTGYENILSTYLEHMRTHGLLTIQDDQYIPTSLGRTELVKMYDKYNEYLKIYDIFCAVDLDAGEFAFSSINEDMSEDQWNDFLNEERFSDVRVAVCDFKGINPVEIVFLSFLNEGRFECNGEDWEYNLTKIDAWIEIEDICNSAVSAEYLTEDGVLENVIREGSKIALELIQQAENMEDEEFYEEEEEYETVTTTETVVEYVDIVEEPYYTYDYYYPYYDPFYVSPIWLTAAILL